MIIAYYSKSKKKDKFKKMFDNLNISKDKGTTTPEKSFEHSKISKREVIQFKKENLTYEETQGKYHTIYIDYSENIKKFKEKGLNTYLLSIEKKIVNELKGISTEFKNIINEYSQIDSYFLNKYLKYLHIKTGEKFIFIIDEWDYMFNHNLFTVGERNDYLSYLKDLLKSKPYVAFAYMTGILPIGKGIPGTDLNFFSEFTMVKDKKYYRYFGFTEKEVKNLCKKNKVLKYKELEEWYDGYISNTGKKIFNSWSVISAFENNDIDNYWKETGSMNEIKNYLNFNIHGVKDDFLRLVTGDKIKIKLRGYSAENKQSKSEEEEKEEEEKNNNNNNKNGEEVMKNEMYSSMVVYGFLTYDSNANEIYIPNKELYENFIFVLEDTKDTQIYNNLKKISPDVLDATLNKNTNEICNLFKGIRMDDEVPNKFYYNHITLGFIVKYAYFDAKTKYNIEQEKTAGKRVVDFIFYPKNMFNGIVIILELKVGTSAKDAIKHIYERQYYNGLKEKGYGGKVLLVGINVTKKTKRYTCVIEEYDERKNNKRRNNNISSDNNTVVVKRRKRKQN
ncbi:hypothetical protein PIROE2DRAFT_16393 [Piromyces sp. E2]|nr:hypothetical protein PIROE2DRAFT_16393 [Piromyces sp. E2]|eukprot:OUM58348.1 hypothetical protein PIROE2DRAFT_16393 [Piromyces sp. E2]